MGLDWFRSVIHSYILIKRMQNGFILFPGIKIKAFYIVRLARKGVPGSSAKYLGSREIF
jgi:hypothetical protein